MASNSIPASVTDRTFGFDALSEARNYRQALVTEFSPFLKGMVVEVGAGIGQFTELLQKQNPVTQVVAVEPEEVYCRKIEKRLSGVQVYRGTCDNLPPGTFCHAVACINVLEHIEDDRHALRQFYHLLANERGALCLFVPARPEIYAPIDRQLRHFRRYTKSDLKEKLETAGFELIRMDYYNFPGYFVWWMLFRVLHMQMTVSGVKLFDRCLFPMIHWLEERVMRPPIGQSLIAVARPKSQ